MEDEKKFLSHEPELLETIYKVIELSLKEEGAPDEAEISLTFVDAKEIQEINRVYRQIDKVTDVLSFPQIEPISQGKIDWSMVAPHEMMLGDIILCYEKAIEQAESYGHSLKREVCFLIAHSMLHLLGYDHMNDEDDKVMIDKQEHLLGLLNISR